ncbi:MAG: hypothetical protein MJZ49_04190 [Bacteroidales bacterium]|nr:hypothetical protein [Bacteroidales bacterium]
MRENRSPQKYGNKQANYPSFEDKYDESFKQQLADKPFSIDMSISVRRQYLFQ